MTAVKINKTLCGLFLGLLLAFGFSAGQARASYEISDGTIRGLWHMNGDSVDSSGLGNNGADTSITYGAGKLSNTSILNGASSFIDVADNATLKFGTGDFSIHAWVYLTSLNNNANVVNKGNDLSGLNYASIYKIKIGSDNKPIAYADEYNQAGGGYALVGSPDALSINTWYDLVMTKSGKTVTLYVNGVSKGTMTASGSNTNTDSVEPLMIGRERYNTATYRHYFPGYLDEVFISSSVLTGTQITDIYNAGAGQEICVTAGCSAGGGGGGTGTTTPLTTIGSIDMSSSTPAIFSTVLGFLESYFSNFWPMVAMIAIVTGFLSAVLYLVLKLIDHQ